MGLFGAGGLKSMGLSVAQTIANLVGADIVAKSITLTQTSGNNAVSLVSGAKLKLGAGAGEVLSSDGTTINAGEAFATAAGNDITSGRSFLTSAASAGVAVLGTNGVYQMGSIFAKNTAPTISSGFGAGAGIVASNGTIAFTVNTGAASASGVIGLPSASNGWVAMCANLSSNDANHAQTKMTANTTTTVTIGNFTSGGVSGNWGANDIIAVICVGF